jgi:predicted dehydrogenase
MGDGAVRVAVVGCGQVSGMYLPVLAMSKDVDVVAVGDVVVEKAEAAAKEHGVAVMRPEQVFASREVDLVLNLTPIPVHAEVTRAALEAGKHVYSEKPLAPSLREARALADLADRRGLELACAPDTLLGSGFQEGRKALDEGAIGTPITAAAYMFRTAFDGATQYAQGKNPFFDMAPYYISALVGLFGAARDVTAYTREVTGEAPVVTSGAASMIAGTVEFASGLLASVILAWGTACRREVPFLAVFGSKGTMRLCNPNVFSEPTSYRPHGDGGWVEVQEGWQEVKGSRETGRLPANLRGLGVAEAARAIRGHRRARCRGDIAVHVVDVVEAMVTSSRIRSNVAVTTTCEPSPYLSATERADLFLA